ncbi:hypothetical protein BGZ98_002914 [Dissophora globulifera]|nr:hypothetical protein BGZ98_002914 [Dissophora globulifera]
MFARPVDPFPAYSPAFSDSARFSNNMDDPKNFQNQHHEQQWHSWYKQQQQQQQRRPEPHQPSPSPLPQRQFDQQLGQEQPPQLDRSDHRKRPLHFEPEFVAALDASLDDPVSSTTARSRPAKKPRRSIPAFNDVSETTNQPTPRYDSSPVFSTSEPTLSPTLSRPRSSISPRRSSYGGPSIIDLSSGEELAALHLGENENKRRRETVESGSSSDSLREVFDVLDDGSLRPILDHAPALPSPMKRLRTDKSVNRSPLEVLGDKDPMGTDTPQRRFSKNHSNTRRKHNAFQNRGQDPAELNLDIDLDLDNNDRHLNGYRDNLSSRMETDSWASDDERSKKSSTGASRAEMGALIRYEGPKTMRLADGVDALLRERWRGHSGSTPMLNSAQGNEMVLYRPPPPIFLSTQDSDNDDDDWQESQVYIEELDDDVPIEKLEDMIMDMDLD